MSPDLILDQSLNNTIEARNLLRKILYKEQGYNFNLEENLSKIFE